MEEILASIRRIISEDDAPTAEAEASPQPQAALEPEPAPEAPFEAIEETPAHETSAQETSAEDVLELTERVEPPAQSVGDLDVYAKRVPEPEPAPAPARAAAVEDEEGLVSEPSAKLAASAFGQLSAAIAMPAAGRTLEDVTRELLRPLLKAWLDQHLPRIVEAKVAEEVERISRTRVR